MLISDKIFVLQPLFSLIFKINWFIKYCIISHYNHFETFKLKIDFSQYAD